MTCMVSNSCTGRFSSFSNCIIWLLQWSSLVLNIIANFKTPAETPTTIYWKELAEARRKALFNVLQENEKVGDFSI